MQGRHYASRDKFALQLLVRAVLARTARTALAAMSAPRQVRRRSA